MTLTPAERTRRYRQTENGKAKTKAYASSARGRAVHKQSRERRANARASVARAQKISDAGIRARRSEVTRARSQRAERQAYVNQIKIEQGCADCGYREHAVALDFDHVAGIKSADVAVLVRRLVPYPELDAEIAKCEVVCANCHRVRTLERRQHGRVRAREVNPQLELDLKEIM